MSDKKGGEESLKRPHTGSDTNQRKIKIRFKNFNPERQREVRAVDALNERGNTTIPEKLDVVSRSNKLVEDVSEKYDALMKGETIDDEKMQEDEDDEETIPLYEGEMKEDWDLLEMKTQDRLRQLARQSIKAKLAAKSER